MTTKRSAKRFFLVSYGKDLGDIIYLEENDEILQKVYVIQEKKWGRTEHKQLKEIKERGDCNKIREIFPAELALILG